MVSIFCRSFLVRDHVKPAFKATTLGVFWNTLQSASKCYSAVLFIIKERHSSTSKHPGAYFRTRPLATSRTELGRLQKSTKLAGMTCHTTINKAVNSWSIIIIIIIIIIFK